MRAADDRALAVLDRESPFHPHELFFSRTDPRGVIRAGNAVFQRVSGYDFGEMLGAPHRIIRHPDMPRAVFRLLWSRIEAGAPIGAYVKNRAKDGGYYWVFAIVTPIEDGYLSVRLKPMSDLSEAVTRAYATARRRETAEGLGPDDSLAALLADLRALGFEDYETFESAALAREVAARDAATGAARTRAAARFETMTQATGTLRGETQAIAEAFEAIRLAPINLRIEASRLGKAASVRTIAESYERHAAAIERHLGAFLAASDQMRATIRDGLFLSAIARIQAEVAAMFRAEGRSEPRIDAAAEAARLDRQQALYRDKAVSGLRDLAKAALRFAGVAEGMTRAVAGLDVARVLCEVEQARLGRAASGLTDTIGRIEAFRADADGRLGRIARLNGDLRDAALAGAHAL